MGVLSLIAKLGLDASGFHRGIKQSESAVSKFGRNATGALKGQLAAAFGTAAFVSATKSLLDYAGKIDDLSFKLGISRSALQEFDYAAAQNSATLDQVTASLAKLSVARMDALRTGNGDIAKAFADLNISVEELKNARLEDLLQKISAAFVEAGDPQQKLGSAIKVLGKSGANLVPVFRASFDAMAAGAHTAGTIIEDETIVKLRKLGDQMTDLKFRSRSLFSELVPVFSMMGRVASQIEAALAATSPSPGPCPIHPRSARPSTPPPRLRLPCSIETLFPQMKKSAPNSTAKTSWAWVATFPLTRRTPPHRRPLRKARAWDSPPTPCNRSALSSARIQFSLSPNNRPKSSLKCPRPWTKWSAPNV
jgi:hypothetical protein